MTQRSTLDLKAEAYFLSAFPEQREEFEGFFLDCHGTKERGRSREVLGQVIKRSVLGHKVIELLGIEVSRNGMYHLLPEAMFQPLSLGNAAANTYEIVHEIRKNREREQGNKLFFSPFDTEFFIWKALMLKRQIGWPNDDRDAVRAIVAEIADQDLGYTGQEALVLLAFFANGHRAKDNAPLLQQFLTQLLKRQVRIRSQNIEEAVLPFIPLGQTCLSVDSILAGSPDIEGSDWRVEIEFDTANELADAAKGDQLKHEVTTLLEYFVLASREIYVVLKALPQAQSPILGQHILGINAYISN